MKHSIYNYIVDQSDDNIIMFNSVSGAVVIVDNDFYTNFKEFNLDNESIETLCEMGFIFIDDSFDEINEILQKNSENQANQDTKIYTICPTTYCNARCFYCFEAGKIHSSMSDEIAEATAKFIIDDANNSNAKKVCLSWFGGEPLLTPNIMERITNEVALGLDSSIEFYANITTNGILFDSDKINLAKRCKIESIQITLDGFGSEYDKRKNYYNEPDAFEKIICIIENLTDAGLDVQVRLNYDTDNFESITKLIKYMNDRFSNEQKQKIEIYAAKLEGIHGCKSCSTSSQIAGALMRQINSSGFAKPFESLNLKYRFAHCLIDSDYYYVIAADGNIYKCNELIDDHKFCVGDVFSGIVTRAKPDDMSNECLECGFLPICQGGCKLRRTSNVATDKCQMEKHIIGDILKMYFA